MLPVKYIWTVFFGKENSLWNEALPYLLPISSVNKIYTISFKRKMTVTMVLYGKDLWKIMRFNEVWENGVILENRKYGIND